MEKKGEIRNNIVQIKKTNKKKTLHVGSQRDPLISKTESSPLYFFG